MKFKPNYNLLLTIALASLISSCELFRDMDEDFQPRDPIFTFEPNKITAKHSWGFGLFIANDHDHVIVSNYDDIYIFKYDSSGIELIQTIDFNETLYIGSLIVHQSSLIFGHTDLDGTGTVFIYNRDGDTWIHSQEIHMGRGDDFFGSDIDIYGDIMIIGASAPFEDDGVNNYDVGSAYIFQRIGGSWIHQREFTAEQSEIDDQFGTCVGIYDDMIVVGSPKIPLHIYKFDGALQLLRTEDMYARCIAHSENNFLVSGDDELWSFSLESDGSFTEHIINDFHVEYISSYGEIIEMKDSLAIIDKSDSFGEQPYECDLFKYVDQQWVNENVISPDSGEECLFHGLALTDQYSIVGGRGRDLDGDICSFVYFRSLTH